jgi:hypothetical protein
LEWQPLADALHAIPFDQWAIAGLSADDLAWLAVKTWSGAVLLFVAALGIGVAAGFIQMARRG